MFAEKSAYLYCAVKHVQHLQPDTAQYKLITKRITFLYTRNKDFGYHQNTLIYHDFCNNLIKSLHRLDYHFSYSYLRP